MPPRFANRDDLIRAEDLVQQNELDLLGLVKAGPVAEAAVGKAIGSPLLEMAEALLGNL